MITFEHFLIAVIIGQFIYGAWREHQNSRERRELYSRIMAESLSDYKAADPKSPLPKGRNVLKKAILKAQNEENPL